MQGIFDKGVLGWVNGLAGAVFGIFVGIFLTGGICLLASSHGSENSNNESVEIVESISNENNGIKFKWAKTTEERNKLWQARHDAYYSVKAEKNNIKVYTTDICVPISNLVEAIKFAVGHL